MISFQDALDESNCDRSILLGNGFSRAFDPKLFDYTSLLEKATFANEKANIKEIFTQLETADFEEVARSLEQTASIAERYPLKTKKLCRKLRKDSEVVLETLVKTLSTTHPSDCEIVSDNQYTSAATFLREFDSFFSLNYDLLLYWVIIKELKNLASNGFRKTQGGQLVWSEEHTGQLQNTFYLHGSLVLTTEHTDTFKTHHKPGQPLIHQIKRNLDQGEFPLIVAEGTSHEKQAMIERNPYLRHCNNFLRRKKGSLFTFGWSLSMNDQHIADCITNGKFEQLYVGIFGGIDSPDNTHTVSAARQIGEKAETVQVGFFDAETAAVWGNTTIPQIDEILY